MAPEDNGKWVDPPAKRRRLQQLFEHGSNAAKQNNYDYASTLFGQCVAGDPGNSIYARKYLEQSHPLV